MEEGRRLLALNLAKSDLAFRKEREQWDHWKEISQRILCSGSYRAYHVITKTARICCSSGIQCIDSWQEIVV